jgi:hypothetical protein
MSTNFIVFGPIDQKLWVFEVFGQGLARAGMCMSQPARVDHLHKKWKAREEKFQKKGIVCPCPGIDLRPLGDQQPLVGCRLILGQGVDNPSF